MLRSEARLASLSRRLAAVAVAMVLMVTGLVVAPSVALAAPGDSGVTQFRVGVDYDGQEVPNACDSGDTPELNGVVATNDSVGLTWGGGFPDVGETYTLSQELPEGWSWDPAVIGQTTSDGGNGLYESTGTVSEDGRTLTVVLTPLVEGADIEFKTLRAVPSPAAADTAYTPSVEVVSSMGTEAAAADEIAVCAEPVTELSKRRVGGGPQSVERDGVVGQQQQFELRLEVPEDAIGQKVGTTIEAPATIVDSWDGPTSSIFLPITTDGVQAEWVAGTNSVVFTLDDDVSMGEMKRIRYAVWWPDEDLPNPADPALPVMNTAHAEWTTLPVQNDRQVVTNLNSSGEGGAGNIGKRLFWAAADSGAEIPSDPLTTGSGWGDVAPNATEVVPSGSMVMAVISHRGDTSADGTPVEYSYRDIADTWDLTQQRLLSDEIWVGTEDGQALPAGDYDLEFRGAGTWHQTVADAGGYDQIDGVRAVVTVDTSEQQYVRMAVPFDVIAPNGTRPVEDRATATVRTAPDSSDMTVSRPASYAVAEVTPTIEKTASATSITSGNSVDFTLATDVAPPADADSAQTEGIVITDVLPLNVDSFEVIDLDGFWTRDADTVDDEGRTVLTFRHDGVVTDTDEIPEITIRTMTSVQAPENGTMENIGTFTAGGETVQDTASVAVFQSNVIAFTKAADPSTIEIDDDQASWTTSWFNYQSSSQGQSYVVDVLPYVGDGRGTDFSGEFALDRLELTADAAVGAVVEYTTDAPELVASTPAEDPDGVISWQPVTDLASPPSDATAVRVVIADFVSGDAGVGSLRVVGAIDGQEAGDLYVNTAFGYLGTADRPMAETEDAIVSVVSSHIEGRVVIDLAQTGEYAESMDGLPDVVVGLFAADDPSEPLQTETVGDDGAYSFEVSSGDYVVRLTEVPEHYSPTFSPVAVPGDRTSDEIAVGLDETVGEVHFGEFLPTSTAGVTKTFDGPFAGDSEEFASTSFVVSYTADDGTSGELQLSADGDWYAELNESLPAGTTVTLTEADVDAQNLPTYVGWEGYSWISGDGYTVSEDGQTATVEIVAGTVPNLILQNSFSELTGTFTVTKEVTGDGAGQVPGDTPFVVEQSLDGGETWEPLGTVTPDEPSVTLPDALRLGTEVLLREQEPPAVSGIEWDAAEFSGEQVTTAGEQNTAAIVIAETGDTRVVLTNPAVEHSSEPTPTPTPEPDDEGDGGTGDGSSDGLAVTGGSVSWIIAGTAGLALVLGALLLGLRRRRA
ncbi:DUF5979 domain-containing protein [Microbacterium halotolerans]|uniref:DUF5979 domain-containing protein n=1 Tax=Microbacterium halotolerans TaxID=246613 RepID=UPI0013C30C29|nr:DUF5979 domain-containing protein [Microbacterium halotolerans]